MLCALMLAVIIMAGCDSSATVQQGRIVETAVTGLNYTTESQPGVTDADGVPDRSNIRRYVTDGFLTATEEMTGDVLRTVTRYEDDIAMTIAAAL